EGGGVKDARDARVGGGLEHGARALDVGRVDLLRVFGPEAIVGGDVEDSPRALDGAPDRRRIDEVALADLDFEPFDRPPITVRSGQYAHAGAIAEQLAGDVGADEPGRAAHQGVD